MQTLSNTIDRIVSASLKRKASVIKRDAARQLELARAQHLTRSRAVWDRRPRYATCTFENFEIYDEQQNRVLDLARQACESLEHGARPNCVAWGPPGTGKDHIIAVMVKKALECCLTVEWMSGPELFASLGERIETNRVFEQIAHLVRKVDVLVLSDPCVCAETLTPQKVWWLFQIVDARYNLIKPTWVSINASSAAEAAIAVGASTVDKLRHDAVIFQCTWESFRGKGN